MRMDRGPAASLSLAIVSLHEKESSRMKIRVGSRQEGSGPGAPAAASEAGPERLGRYLLGELLGIGGMGRVYGGYDPELDRKVAIKLLWRSDPFLLVRFLQEAQLQARLDHPNICKIYEVEANAAAPFIAMQRIHGHSLLDRTLDLELEQVLDLMIQCAEAVQAAHDAGMIHRDLKPGNILLEADGAGGWHPWLLDFGLAKDLAGPDLTQGSRVMGTPAFMAPEQALGKGVSVRSDLYSLGATFYAFLGGRAPFQAASATELLVRQSREQPPSLTALNPVVPAALATIIHTCLRREPRLRYGSAAALAQDLGRLKAGQPIQARPPLASRTWVQLTAAAALATLLAGAGLLALRPPQPPLAGLSGRPGQPLQLLVMPTGFGGQADSWMQKSLTRLVITTLWRAPGLRTLTLGSEELPVPPPTDLAAAKALLRNEAADLALLVTLRPSGDRLTFSLATLRPGESQPRPLMERTFEPASYYDQEREINRNLTRLLGLPGPGHQVYLPSRPETRQAIAQVMELKVTQQNSESDRTAIGILRQILSREPDYPQAHAWLSEMLNGQANEAAHHGRMAEMAAVLAESRREAETAIRLEPGGMAGYQGLGTAQRLAGDLEGAQRTAQLSLEADPEDPSAHWQMAMAASLRPGQEAHRLALAHARRGVELDRRQPQAHYRLAHIHQDAGQFPQALAALEPALRQLPTLEYGQLMRSNLLLWSGRGAEAESALKAALAVLPNSRMLKRNQVYSAFLARDAGTFPHRFQVCRDIWPEGHPTREFLEGLREAFAGRWERTRARYGRALAAARIQAPTLPFSGRSSFSVDFYLMGRVLAEGPDRTSARPFIAFADTLFPKRLRMAQRDPAFRGLWPEAEPWPGD
jgi:tetratricopeptide (TPR) repeat protein